MQIEEVHYDLLGENAQIAPLFAPLCSTVCYVKSGGAKKLFLEFRKSNNLAMAELN